MKTIASAGADKNQSANPHPSQPISHDGWAKIAHPTIQSQFLMPQTPDIFAKFHQTTQMSAYGRHRGPGHGVQTKPTMTKSLASPKNYASPLT
jgi:hypothetical protein